jgi:hypothetical protein
VISIDGRVQTLTMRAPDDATWQRVAELVEEAIRTAALDAELPGRVFVVRQLDIGTIARSPSPQSLALAIQAAVERVTAQAVSGEDPAASTAPMIYFKDDTNAVLSLAQRVATNKPSTEWFWPSVVKSWTPSMPPERAIPLLIERAVSTSGGVVTLAQVVDVLASTGVIDKLLERLSPQEGRALLETIGWTDAMVVAARGSDGGARVANASDADAFGAGAFGAGALAADAFAADASRLVPPMPARSQQLVQRWVTQWKSDARDPRAVWLGAMLLVADRPGRATSAELPEVVRRWLAAVVAQSRASDGEEAPNEVAAQAVRRDDLIADARAWLQSHPRSPLDSLFGGGPPRPITPGESIVHREDVERRLEDDERRLPRSEPPVWRHPRRSDHAGFLFLIPLLTRTGLTAIVAGNPGLIERDWPAALLVRIARRLGIPNDDPAIAWAFGRPTTIAHADRSLTAEVLRAARIRLRMQVGMPMRQVVGRSGAIVATRTHIEVFLDRGDVDSNIRQAGLDADAAFAPWLGRDVQFHYLGGVDVSG